jgi:hypothetical protein
MRDARITAWVNPTTKTTVDEATNGPTIDLADGITLGSHSHGVWREYGIGLEIMAHDVVTGTGDGFTVAVKVQTSPDDSAWTDFATVGTFTIDTDGYFEDADDNPIGPTLTRQKMTTRVRTSKRYIRLVMTTLGMTNGEVVQLSAWVSDGTNAMVDSGQFS